MGPAYPPYLDTKGRRLQQTYPLKNSLHIGFDNVVPFSTREDWGAALPRQSSGYLRKPATHARIIDTRTDSCKTKEQCVRVLRDLQTYHMNNGLCDIPYSFMIGENLTVYEGRGFVWNPLLKQDYEELDEKTIDIGLIGTFQDESPPPKMMALSIDVINSCVMRRVLIAKFDLIPFPERKERQGTKG